MNPLGRATTIVSVNDSECVAVPSNIDITIDPEPLIKINIFNKEWNELMKLELPVDESTLLHDAVFDEMSGILYAVVGHFKTSWKVFSICLQSRRIKMLVDLESLGLSGAKILVIGDHLHLLGFAGKIFSVEENRHCICNKRTGEFVSNGAVLKRFFYHTAHFRFWYSRVRDSIIACEFDGDSISEYSLKTNTWKSRALCRPTSEWVTIELEQSTISESGQHLILLKRHCDSRDTSYQTFQDSFVIIDLLTQKQWNSAIKCPSGITNFHLFTMGRSQQHNRCLTAGYLRRSWKGPVLRQSQCIPDALVGFVKQYLLDEVVYLMPYAVSAPEDTPMDAYKINLDALLQNQDESDSIDMMHEQFDSGVLKQEKQKNEQ